MDKMKKHIDLNTLILVAVAYGTWHNSQAITASDKSIDSIKDALYYKLDIKVPSRRDDQSGATYSVI